MYTEFFGLNQKPFAAIAQGEGVYAGPRQAQIMGKLMSALTVPDAIVAVTGAVGVGKTTIVSHALASLGSDAVIASIRRTLLTPDDLLDRLLAQFGFSPQSTSAGRTERLIRFREFVKERGEANARVFILVEDAPRMGVDLVAELEALTAAGTDCPMGANVILMGQPDLNELLKAPPLEHVRQRTHLRQPVKPLTGDEVEAYLRHRVEAAGGDFGAIFAPGTSIMLHACSGGIPRVINNLCETALTVVAKNKLKRLVPRLVKRIAVAVFGIEVPDVKLPSNTDVAVQPAPQAPAAAKADPQPEARSPAKPSVKPNGAAAPQAAPKPQTAPKPQASAQAQSAAGEQPAPKPQPAAKQVAPQAPEKPKRAAPAPAAAADKTTPATASTPAHIPPKAPPAAARPTGIQPPAAPRAAAPEPEPAPSPAEPPAVEPEPELDIPTLTETIDDPEPPSADKRAASTEPDITLFEEEPEVDPDDVKQWDKASRLAEVTMLEELDASLAETLFGDPALAAQFAAATQNPPAVDENQPRAAEQD